MGIKTVPHLPYSPDLVPCYFWLFPKLRGCRYETIEEMKGDVMKVIDKLTQEDFDWAFQKLMERYKCILAGGDYFEGDSCFMCVISIKVPIRKSLETYLMILVNTYTLQEKWKISRTWKGRCYHLQLVCSAQSPKYWYMDWRTWILQDKYSPSKKQRCWDRPEYLEESWRHDGTSCHSDSYGKIVTTTGVRTSQFSKIIINWNPFKWMRFTNYLGFFGTNRSPNPD